METSLGTDVYKANYSYIKRHHIVQYNTRIEAYLDAILYHEIGHRVVHWRCADFVFHLDSDVFGVKTMLLLRECNVYCEVKPYTAKLEALKALNPIGIIFTGGPNSVYAPGAPGCDAELFRLGVPILGICYGCQLMAHMLGGRVNGAQEDTAREDGKT